MNGAETKVWVVRTIGSVPYSTLLKNVNYHYTEFFLTEREAFVYSGQMADKEAEKYEDLAKVWREKAREIRAKYL